VHSLTGEYISLSVHHGDYLITMVTVEKTDMGDQYRLTKVYEHKLQRTACNMVHGPFGGPKGNSVMYLRLWRDSYYWAVAGETVYF